MSGTLPGSIDGQTRELLRRAGTVLDGDQWWAVVADGALCGDADLAARCVDLGERLSRQALGDEPAGPPVTIEDVVPLIRSGLVNAIVAGATYVRHIARLQPAEAAHALPAFRQAPARAREIMLRYSVRPGDDGVSAALLEAGLRDKSRRVRLAAGLEVERSDSPGVLAALREVMRTEKDPEVLDWMRRSESLVSKGYWIGPAEHAARDVQLRLGMTTSVPVATFEEFGEDEVIRRLRRSEQGVSSPTFKEDERWLSEQNEKWRATEEFAAFRESFSATRGRAMESESEKRAARVSRLKGEGAFLEAAEFLDGNEDEGSIGCNLDPHPGLGAFRRVVKGLLMRDDVTGVFVQIKEVTRAPAWPFTDSMLVCTNAGVKDVEAWFRRLRPDSVAAAARDVPGPAPEGFRWLEVWWD